MVLLNDYCSYLEIIKIIKNIIKSYKKINGHFIEQLLNFCPLVFPCVWKKQNLFKDYNYYKL